MDKCTMAIGHIYEGEKIQWKNCIKSNENNNIFDSPTKQIINESN